MKLHAGIPRLGLFALVGLLLACPDTALAHEKWFYDAAPYPTRWEEVVRFPGIASVGVALAVTALIALWWRARRGRDLIPGPEILGATEAGRSRFYALVPLILAVHVGLPLLVLGIMGNLFSPNNRLAGPGVYWLGVIQIGVGVAFLYGSLTRLAGAALGGLWLVGIWAFGLEPMLENLHYLGFAAFFFLTGRGPYAIDRLLFPALEPSPQLARRAMVSLRVATALGLATVAFTEKLANPELGRAFLQVHPLNFTAWIGLPMSDEMFILCAGTSELVIGLCLTFGLFPRVIIASIWLMLNMTLTIFDWVELVGHLPLYGAMAILLIWTPQADDQRLWEQGVLGEGSTGKGAASENEGLRPT